MTDETKAREGEVTQEDWALAHEIVSKVLLDRPGGEDVDRAAEIIARHRLAALSSATPADDLITRVARAIYEADPIIHYPNLDCLGGEVQLRWEELQTHEVEHRLKLARAALASIQPPPDGEA